MKQLLLRQFNYDNNGFSLVELLVAIAIGAVISGSVVALIAFSLRTYDNESTNTSMQYELQTNVNQIVDEIMASSGLVIKQRDANQTEYAAFGDFRKTSTGNITFDGVAFYADAPAGGRFKIYMNRFTGTGSDSYDAVSGGIDAIKNAITAGASNPDYINPYILGDNATKFKLTPDPKNTSLLDKTLATGDASTTKGKYVNPLSVKVELTFSKEGSYKKYTKNVNDEAVMRNKAMQAIYIDGNFYKLKLRDED